MGGRTILRGPATRGVQFCSFRPSSRGLALGAAVIGAAALPINFCALGAVADILFARDWRRMRAWMLAAGVAVLGTQGLAAAGLVRAPVGVVGSWLAVALGGVVFGYGMALCGGCINRALVRVGVGSFKSLVIVVVTGASAALTTLYLPGPVSLRP